MKRNMIITLGVTVALMLVAANAMAGCTVYKYKGYIGGSKVIAAGQEISSLDRKWNNEISAAKISPGCQLSVWKDAGFEGDKRDLTGNVRFVGNHWDEVISSTKCVCQDADQGQSADRE